ncbi:hypothetical protein DL93DRAFT_2089147 [Clavulina sp. PMI_390]|nr:hypothetical protein DL93DRAFT_2089147 [Clavulina sp. PMI_390]
MATWALLRTFFKPTLAAPAVRVPSIRHLDFEALKRAGYKGAVFDKDNCLDAWRQCLRTFGKENVVIVSNATGTRSDPGYLEAESVAHHLGVPVLAHTTPKPGCSSTIITYFASRSPNMLAARPKSHPVLPFLSNSIHELQPIEAASSPSTTHTPIKPSELIVVGDRVFTDVILGNRLGALPIWTTGLWQRELMPMRYIEYGLVGLLDTWARRGVYARSIARRWSSFYAWVMRMAGRELPGKDSSSVPPEEVLPPTPQQLFVLPPTPIAPKETSLTPWIRGAGNVVRLIGSVAQLTYRGARLAVLWINQRIQQRGVAPPVADTSEVEASRNYLAFDGATASKASGNALAAIGRVSRSASLRILSLMNTGIKRLTGVDIHHSSLSSIHHFQKRSQDLLERTQLAFSSTSAQLAKTNADISLRIRQLSSRLGMMARRVMRSWPSSSSSDSQS